MYLSSKHGCNHTALTNEALAAAPTSIQLSSLIVLGKWMTAAGLGSISWWDLSPGLTAASAELGGSVQSRNQGKGPGVGTAQARVS